MSHWILGENPIPKFSNKGRNSKTDISLLAQIQVSLKFHKAGFMKNTTIDVPEKDTEFLSHLDQVFAD